MVDGKKKKEKKRTEEKRKEKKKRKFTTMSYWMGSFLVEVASARLS